RVILSQQVQTPEGEEERRSLAHGSKTVRDDECGDGFIQITGENNHGHIFMRSVLWTLSTEQGSFGWQPFLHAGGDYAAGVFQAEQGVAGCLRPGAYVVSKTVIGGFYRDNITLFHLLDFVVQFQDRPGTLQTAGVQLVFAAVEGGG